MSNKCPECNADNPDTKQFCGDCGTQLMTALGETRTLRTSAKDSKIGEIISEKYKLLEELGSGGMGVVYKAEQIKPVKRSVALKIIKLGMDTRHVVARFETERQALAVMDHPNIAKVYDGGATDIGRPYFVMELMRGVPITDYCDKHKLTTKERLELFIQVCQAIQHAHQKGVIHRDLKPSNILVGIQEDKPIPKIIDFGIAKATEHSLTERTLFTEQGQLIGTPEYMSPEQAEMSGLDVDTRTDIYSLGVMLYELLVGVLPFDPETFREAGFGEIQRIIREVEPPRASTRLSGLGNNQASIAKQRRTDVPSLHKQVKGDLDWITMKAMEKDRTRRYSAVSDLIADITRHLKKEPIIARPPSRIYNVGKFIRRHRWGVAMAALLIIAIVVGGTVATIGFVRATRAENKAKEEAQTANQVSDFLVNLFRVSDPEESRGNSITAREILDKGAEKIEQELSDQPIIKSRIMETIGQVYQNLGLYSLAEPLLKKTLDIRRDAVGDDHYYTGKSLINLAWLYLSQNLMEDAEPLVRQGVAVLEKTTPEETPDLSRGLTMLGMINRNRGEFDLAQTQLEKALAICERTLGPDHELTANPLYHLGWLYKLKGEYEKAEKTYERAYVIWERKLGLNHPWTLWCLNDMAVVAENKGDRQKAKDLNRKVIDTGERVFGPDHPFLAASLSNLSIVLWRLGEYAEAEICAKRSIAIREKVFGKDHPLIAGTLNNISLVYLETGAYSQSRESLERAFAINEKTGGPESLGMAETLHNLAVLELYTKDYESAEMLFAQTLALYEKILGPDHPDIALILSDYALMSRVTGNYAAAESFYRRALEINEKNYGAESNGVAASLINLARLYAAQKDLEKADSFCQRSLDIYEKNVSPDSPNFLFNQASYWAVAGDKERALEYLRRALEAGYTRTFFNNLSFRSLRGNEDFEVLVTESMKKMGLKKQEER